MNVNRQSRLNLLKLFPVGGDGVILELERLMLPRTLTEKSGHRIQVFVDNKGRMLKVDAPEVLGGGTRLSVYFLKTDVPPDPIGVEHVKIKVDVPFCFIAGYVPLLKYTLYNIRFAATKDSLPETLCAPLFRGYYGITKRHPFQRFSEHLRDMQSGAGYALHTAWRALKSLTSLHHPVIQISGTHEDLKGIYALEEEAVKLSLAPAGLNVIPGGEAGIRMLYQLGLTNRLKLGVDERDALLAELETTERSGPAAHYRRGHLRKLSVSRSTWVSPCWVALQAAA